MKDRLQQRWQTLADAFLARARRERVLMLVAASALVALGAWQLLVTPVLEARSQVAERIASTQESLEGLTAQEETLLRELEKDPNEPLRERISQLQQRLDRYDQQLEELTTGLISPPEMVTLLRRMLARHDGVALESVSHRAPQPVAVEGQDDGANSEQEASLYAHPVEVTVSGGFHDVLAYLRDLEGLDERLGWRSMDYQTQDWPGARVRIRLHTLSLHREWLGV
ncbi:MSHA biogenesis protein MshJ [Halovibrio salipaludis]|uniref:MSHA biogenesis protein MshJ n=1 Tax=Halovibrio salipaludis TaxID=2032626 RepID=A0A2A2EV68_9GAMM|nr:type II secretion system protein M [Halovibrio salipaludis]PAU76364.1 MSHA biogenesis protein MshJ [Halovibrio salipaludis]